MAHLGLLDTHTQTELKIVHDDVSPNWKLSWWLAILATRLNQAINLSPTLFEKKYSMAYL
jgi:hypothetical protein